MGQIKAQKCQNRAVQAQLMISKEVAVKATGRQPGPTPLFGTWWLNRRNSAQVGLVLDRPDFMQKSVLYSSWGPDIDLLQKLTLNMRGSKYVILVSTRHQWLSVPAWDQQNLPDVGLRSAPHLQSARPLLTVNYITTSVSRQILRCDVFPAPRSFLPICYGIKHSSCMCCSG